MKQKGQMLIIGIIIGVLVAGGLFGAYYFGTLKNSKPEAVNSVTIPENQQVTNIPVPSLTPDKTANPNWKTYTNTTFGFSVKYPEYLKSNESADGVYLSDGKGQNFTVTVLEQQSVASVQATYITFFDQGHGPEKYTTKIVTLDSVQGTEYFGCAGVDGCRNTYYLIAEKGNRVYVISYDFPDKSKDDYQKIISTFKFTN